MTERALSVSFSYFYDQSSQQAVCLSKNTHTLRAVLFVCYANMSVGVHVYMPEYVCARLHVPYEKGMFNLSGHACTVPVVVPPML